MKVLLLNGSPRPQGNTAKMAAAFRETAEEAEMLILTAAGEVTEETLDEIRKMARSL